MNKEIRQSLFAFSFFVLILIGVKLFIILNPNILRSVAQVGVFEWPFLLVWTVLGGTGVALATKSGFALPWDRSISLNLRVIYPLFIGLFLGALAVAVDAETRWADWVAGQLKIDTIHIPFPVSIPIYLGGSIIVEIVYQIFPIGFLYWLISKVIMKRDNEVVFWILATLTSMLEPSGSINLYKHSMLAAVMVVCHDFAMNISQAWFFRKAGIVSALFVRVGYYLLWHIGWGWWQQSI
jgi:hypothetical protein